MCTLTYLPLGKNNFILTSNRDESPLRKTIPPKEYLEDGVSIVYSKDEIAGGTWIGFSEKQRLVCLLNGAFTKHIRETTYKMSRGIVVKKMLIANNAVSFINDFDFEGIEPFTLVLIDWEDSLKIYELVWDGSQSFFTELKNEPKIWSSSTLYTHQMKMDRQQWFKDWLVNNDQYTQSDILKFHENDVQGNSDFSLKMKREFVETVSVTSIKKTSENVSLVYKNIFDEVKTEQMKLQ